MTFAFVIIAALTLAAAVAAMALRNLVHCALALTVAFAGLASSQNFFAIIGALTSETDVKLSVAAGRPASRRRVRR